MGTAQNTINDGVAEVHIRGGHVDLRAQALFPVRIFPLPHFAEELKIFLWRTVPVRAFLSRLGEGAARRADLFGGQVADKGLAFRNQLLRIVVNDVEKVGGIHLLRPLIPYPFDIAADRLDEFRLFFGRVGVVEKEIAFAAVLLRCCEVEAYGLGMSYMQVAVGFGRKTGLNFGHSARVQILVDDLLDEICRFYLFHMYSDFRKFVLR